MALPGVLELAHDIAAAHVAAGDWVVDATIGNGHDTAFLAGRVGSQGRVFGFDVQREAITNAERRLRDAGVAEGVTLFEQSHERLDEHLPPEARGRIAACMFNLGYLPGGDKSIITRPSATLPALEAALRILRPRGIVTIVQYRGHPGGGEEAKAVTTWAMNLDANSFASVRYEALNRSSEPPALIAVERLQ